MMDMVHPPGAQEAPVSERSSSASAPSLPTDYTLEVDGFDAARWQAIVEQFADANIYQTWAYGAERSGVQAMSHAVLRRRGEVVAAAQLRIAKLPLLPVGVAYARWAPMWRRRGRADNPDLLRFMLRGLREEYSRRRGLAVRLLPLAFAARQEELAPILESEGYELLRDEPVQRTLLLPLDEPLDALRRNLEQKWRNCLNRAERNELTLRSGSDGALFDEFVGLYRQMHQRKGFHETSDVNEFRRIQDALTDTERLRVGIVYANHQPVAGIVCSAMGDTGIYLYGATGDVGMGTNASYLLQWDALTWLKSRGCRWYNLHGINPQTNPGTYRFKVGLAGKTGIDDHYLGTYQVSAGPLSRTALQGANWARAMIRAWRRRAGKTSSTSEPRG